VGFNQAVAAESWEEVEVWESPLPPGYLAYVDHVASLAAQPLLPVPIRDAFDRYLAIVAAMPFQTLEEVNRQSHRLPEYYPAVEDVLDSSTAWILKELPLPQLEDYASAIVDAAVDYLGARDLLSIQRKNVRVGVARDLPEPLRYGQTLLVSKDKSKPPSIKGWPPRGESIDSEEPPGVKWQDARRGALQSDG
jgi:hypothetical protein